jgi:sporulation protein YunB
MGVRRRKWRSAKRSAWNNSKRIFFVLLITFGGLALFLWIYVERNIKPAIMHHAQIRITQTATRAINTAITEQVAANSEFQQLVDWRTDTSGKVSGFSLNYLEHMRITATTVRIVQDTLTALGKQKERIPLGQAFQSTFLTSYGPSIPVQFEPAGAVKVDLNTRQKNAGINMLLVEVYIRVTVNMTVLVPLDAKTQTVQTELPISYMLIVGDVPDYMIQPTPITK